CAGVPVQLVAHGDDIGTAEVVAGGAEAPAAHDIATEALIGGPLAHVARGVEGAAGTEARCRRARGRGGTGASGAAAHRVVGVHAGRRHELAAEWEVGHPGALTGVEPELARTEREASAGAGGLGLGP